MGILDRSKSITENVETNISTPQGIQGDDNQQIVALGGDVYTVNTDHNAIDRATELAERSLVAGENLARDSFSLSLETSRGVIDASRDAQDFVAEIAGRSQSLAGDVLDVSERVASGAQESAAGFLDTALDFTRGLQTKFQDTIGSTVDALQRIGVEQNKSTDQRLAESSERALKYALIGLGVMAVGIVAFAAMRK